MLCFSLCRRLLGLGAEAPGAEAAAQSAVSGIVRDESGGAVSGASVVLVIGSSGLEQQTVSGPDGRFTLAMPPTGDLTLIVRAGGFAEWTQSVPANREIEVVLHDRRACSKPSP